MKKTLFLLLGVVLLLPVGVEAKGDKVNDAFGANIHLRQRIDSSDWTTVMDKASNGNVQWGREQFNWDVIEPADGTYSWSAYDSVVDSYEASGVEMLGLLTYSSSWASENSASSDYEFYPPDLKAWKDYVYNVAKRYKGRVTYWEIWNEPNHAGFWKGTTDEYVTYFEAAVNQIRKANPDAKIVLGGLSGSDYTYLDTVYSKLDDKTDIDVVAIHPYRQANGSFNYQPEQTVEGLNTFSQDLYNVKSVIRRHGQKDTPIWITEMGWTTYEDGVTDLQQAQYLIRAYSIALSVPDVQKVFWYTFNDTSDNTTFFESHFGLLEDDYTDKDAFSAYQYAFRNLDGRYFKDQKIPNMKLVDDFAGRQGWEFVGTQCTNGTLDDSYNGVMKVSYAFTADTNCYAPIALNKKLPDNTRALQFRAKGENDDTTLRVRIKDSQGETFQYTLGLMPKQWLFYTIQIKEYHNNWGGDGDGVIDYPITFDSFVLDDKDGERESGLVYFDDFYSSKRGKAYLYRYHKDNFDIYAYWSSGKKRTFRVHLDGAGRVRVKRWRRENIEKSSGDAHYSVKATKGTKFLQTL